MDILEKVAIALLVVLIVLTALELMIEWGDE